MDIEPEEVEQEELDSNVEPDEELETEAEPELEAEPEATLPKTDEALDEPKGSRASDRIRRQQAELNETRVREKLLQERLTTIERERTEQQTLQRQQQQQAYIDNLDPEARQQALLDQRFAAMQQTMQRQQWEMQEHNDKMSFHAQSAQNPLIAKYEARVEAQLATMRQAGQTAPRESVFYFLVGQDMAKKVPAAATKQRAAGAAKLKASQGTPSRTRSDASRGADKDDESLEALEARLANAQF